MNVRATIVAELEQLPRYHIQWGVAGAARDLVPSPHGAVVKWADLARLLQGVRAAPLQLDAVCEHGTALDVHCCNCHSGFLFDVDSCVCEFRKDAEVPEEIIEIDADGTVHAQTLEGAMASALNRFSQENPSNTPDFILAQYLLACLAAWNTGVQQRETWYGRDARPGYLGGDVASPGARETAAPPEAREDK